MGGGVLVEGGVKLRGVRDIPVTVFLKLGSFVRALCDGEEDLLGVGGINAGRPVKVFPLNLLKHR